jgi:hypothetical protein
MHEDEEESNCDDDEEEEELDSFDEEDDDDEDTGEGVLSIHDICVEDEDEDEDDDDEREDEEEDEEELLGVIERLMGLDGDNDPRGHGLVGQNRELLSSRDQDGALPLHVACRRGASFTVVQYLVDLNKASVKSLTSEGDLPLFLACEMPETSLDAIFLMTKLYPDLLYR